MRVQPITPPAPRVAAEEVPLKARVLRVLETNRLACEYQPIVRTDSEEIWGYEALARFVLDGEAIAPNRVFNSLHNDRTLFFMLESRSKRFQIEHRPGDAQLFVNLDPHVCEESYQLEHWLETLRGHDELVVEIIENTSVTNLDNIRAFTRSLSEAGVHVALDDVGGTNNLFSFELLDNCDYVKLDRRWFSRLAAEPSYGALLRGLVEFARAKGIHTVLEGVESRRHLSIAKALGVDFVQGFLFSDAFVLVKDARPLLDGVSNLRGEDLEVSSPGER